MYLGDRMGLFKSGISTAWFWAVTPDRVQEALQEWVPGQASMVTVCYSVILTYSERSMYSKG